MGVVLSAHDCSRGGLGVTVSEMSIGSGIGATVDLRRVIGDGALREDVLLFSEGRSRIVLEVRRDRMGLIRRVLGSRGVPWSVIGRTGGRRLRIRSGRRELIDLTVGELRRAWSSLDRIMEGWR